MNIVFNGHLIEEWPLSKEMRALIYPPRKKPYIPEETRKRMAEASRNRVVTIETRLKISKAKRGKKSHLWKGGVSKKNRTERSLFMSKIEYRFWREAVFKRDDWTCQICNRRGGKLQADHIKPYSLFPELRLDLSNGRTLCIECHKKTPTYGHKVKALMSTV